MELGVGKEPNVGYSLVENYSSRIFLEARGLLELILTFPNSWGGLLDNRQFKEQV
jgi:hypothetical protein